MLSWMEGTSLQGDSLAAIEGMAVVAISFCSSEASGAGYFLMRYWTCRINLSGIHKGESAFCGKTQA